MSTREERKAERAKRMRERTPFTARVSAHQRESDLKARRSQEGGGFFRRADNDPNKPLMYWVEKD